MKKGYESVTHTNQRAADGTSLVGDIRANYSDLKALFGEPGDGDGYKVSTEFVIRFVDGEVATIYDWKASDLYEDGAYPVSTIRSDDWDGDWNIGGTSAKVAQRIKDILEDHTP